jgi:hypothetical protein
MAYHNIIDMVGQPGCHVEIHKGPFTQQQRCVEHVQHREDALEVDCTSIHERYVAGSRLGEQRHRIAVGIGAKSWHHSEHHGK